MLRIHLLGRHAHRTPAAYPPYRQLLRRLVEYVDHPVSADVLVLGFRADIPENIDVINDALRRKPDLRLAIVSEEPLWDTLWGGDFRAKHDLLESKAGTIQYAMLNHFTSDIFDWRYLPYYITTSDDFFARYRSYFLRNTKLGKSALLQHFRTRLTHNAFFCERRVDARFIPTRTDAAHLGLSVMRSLFADELRSMGCVIREGKGWHSDQPRQRLPDWHLDKLVQLDCQSQFVAAMENTLVDHYLTEKIFDAYAVLSVPLYAANANHRVFEFAHRDSFVNLLDIDPPNAPDVLDSFQIDEDFLNAYWHTQQSLFERFKHVDILYEERVDLVNRLVRALEAVAADPVKCRIE